VVSFNSTSDVFLWPLATLFGLIRIIRASQLLILPKPSSGIRLIVVGEAFYH
jgi:hypothetical protein